MVEIMGHLYPDDNVPEFGTICARQLTGNNVNEYALTAADVAKLANIANAADGSTALAVDTKDLYVKISGVWSKVGGNG